MSEWQNDDEVTTTYGSIQLSLSQAHAAGIKTERERIINLIKPKLNEIGCCNCGMYKVLEIIKGETNE